jgi:hypothetical protein
MKFFAENGFQPVETDSREKYGCPICGSLLGPTTSLANVVRHFSKCNNRGSPNLNLKRRANATVDRPLFSQATFFTIVCFFAATSNIGWNAFNNPFFMLICSLAFGWEYSARSFSDHYRHVLLPKWRHKIAKWILEECAMAHFTADIWTDGSRSVVGVTAHFIDKQFRVCNISLDMRDVANHSGQTTARAIFEIISEFGIDNKVVSIVMDNASVNKVISDIISSRISNLGQAVIPSAWIGAWRFEIGVLLTRLISLSKMA